MRPINALLALAVLLVPLMAPASEEIAEKSAKQSSRDVKIPRALVARIEREYREFLKANQLPEGEGLKRKLMDISVELKQKREAALHEDVRINTPLGGGIVDLAEFVTPLRGAFHFKILPHHEGKTEISGLRVFFVSQAKQRILGGEDYGAGCDKFMEVTGFFHQKMAGPGFEMFTADQRYVSVLGGTFVLVSFDKEALEVGSVSFYDSRYPQLTCE